MDRTISVKGTAQLSLRPDTVLISMTLKSLDKEYERAMAVSQDQLLALQQAISRVGFSKEDLKTEQYNVYTEKESVQDENGNYKTVFAGYSCVHRVYLRFAFDNAKLSAVMSSVSSCSADPDVDIKFTVKDKETAKELLLKLAAKDAKSKAKILASASGAKLGNIITVDYSMNNNDMDSPTGFFMEKRCMPMGNPINIEPDDITISDSVLFVWEII